MLADESFRQMERIETIAQSHRVAETALETYHYAVPDKVKPRDSEWTVMAAIVLEDRPRRDFDDELREEEDRELRREPWRGLPWRAGPSVFRTVALATGSKCAGEAAVATAAARAAAVRADSAVKRAVRLKNATKHRLVYKGKLYGGVYPGRKVHGDIGLKGNYIGNY
mgnify:CR=1 FL=1